MGRWCMCKKYYDYIICVIKIKYNFYLCKNYSLIPTEYIGAEDKQDIDFLCFYIRELKHS